MRKTHADTESTYYAARREIRPLMALMDRIEDSEDHAEDFALACVRVNASLAHMAESVDGSTPLGTALNSAAAVVACAAASVVLMVDTGPCFITPAAVPDGRELLGSIRCTMNDLWNRWSTGDVEDYLPTETEEVAHA